MKSVVFSTGLLCLFAASVGHADSYNFFTFDTGSGSPEIDAIIPEDGYALQLRGRR